MNRGIAVGLSLPIALVLLGSGRADAGSSTPAVAVAPPATPVIVGDSVPASSVERSVSDALAAIAPHVTRSSHPDALRLAFVAYFRYRDAHPERVRKPYLYYVDYGLDNRTARGYVFDMEAQTVLEGPFNVAHGRGSSRGRDGVPTSFSNRAGSNATSLGLYLTQETYSFSGRSGGRRYTSVGLRLAGLSDGFNDAARRRGVVTHGAPYVSARDAGRSEGCPAMEQARARRLLPMIANGALVFLYSPHDPHWLGTGPWIRGATQTS
ncbi:MAG TPA: murein L,D-transpeptidase catalytic domain family protein [Longimicrobiales bacterium]|nr:murein L,D-transpeptidase catalytic domain family protein [Longimicrobiales bacterium]